MARSADHRNAGDYLLVSKKCDILSLEYLLETGQLVVCAGNLVHALQQERGVSSMYAASAGRRYAKWLARRLEASGSAEDAFRERLGVIDTTTACMPGASRLFSRIAYAVHGLDELPRVRDAIGNQVLRPESITDGYSQLIASLLGLIFEAADTAADAEISRLLVAMFHLIQGKELAGQERAAGATGFIRGHFDEDLKDRMKRLIDGQEHCFRIFAGFADPETLEAWNTTGANQCPAEMERLRRIALLSDPERSDDPAPAETWFALATRRINAMKRVENRLQASLATQCERSLAEAREDLASHRTLIEELSHRQPAARGAFTVFFQDAPSGADAIRAGDTLDAGLTSPRLGRSLVDLVQSQSLRLQRMADELREAREALAERKTIEKAKGLIMKHRGLAEDEAYRFLRDVAMAQSRRLADVAKDTVAMADVFGRPDRD